MSDDAHLGIDVDSSSVAAAAVNLDAMAQAAVRAGEAVDFMTDSGRVVGALWSDNLREIEQNIGALRALRDAQMQVSESQGTGAGGGGVQGQVQNLNNLRFAAMNVAAQFQDIAVTSQMGQSPFTIALQQGTQLSSVMNMMAQQAGGSGGVWAVLKQGIADLISPVALLTIGLVGVGAAVLEWGLKATNAGKSVDELFKEHNKTISDTVKGYKDASQAASEFANSRTELSQGAVEEQLGQSLKDAIKQNDNFTYSVQNAAAATRDSQNVIGQALHRAAEDFLQGKTSISAFQTTLAELNNIPVNIFSTLDEVFSSHTVNNLFEASKAAKLFEDALVGIEQVLAATGHNQDTQYTLDQFMQGKRAAEGNKIEMDSINAKSPAQLADIARRRESLALVDQTMDDSLRQQKIDDAGAQAYASASHQISEADRQRLQSARDSIAAEQTKYDTMGKSIAQQESASFVQQQMAAAEAEAAQNGVSVSQKYRDTIQQLGDEYGKLAQKVKEQGTISDLMFAHDQMGRSAEEQGVASTLREIYGDDFASQMNGFIARQTRVNYTLKELSDVGKGAVSGFLSTFASEWKSSFLASDSDNQTNRIQYASQLLTEAQKNNAHVTVQQRAEIVKMSQAMADAASGATALQRAWKTMWTSAGDAAGQALDKIGTKVLDMASEGVWDWIFKLISGAVGGMAGGGISPLSFVGSGFGSYGQFASGTSSAPPGLAWVGERGRELVNFRGGEQVHSAADSARMAGGSGTAIFQIDARGAQKGVAEQIGDYMDVWMRTTGPSWMKSVQANPDRR